MKKLLAMFAGITVVILILPVMIVGSWEKVVPTPDVQQTDTVIKLYVCSDQQLISISLEEYIKGVVAAEMPASFHTEALRAQAIAARTYAIKRVLAFGGKGCQAHPQADLCTDPAHCQAWLPATDLQQKWGMIEYQNHLAKINHAVESTAGQILTYQGIVIDPLFHSTCGGSTEDAGAVWQQSLPYLVPVKCSYCQHSPKLKSELRLNLGAFIQAMQQLDGSIAVTAQALQTTASPTLAITGKTATGRASTVTLAGKKIAATTMRSALGLNSTHFNYKITDGQIVFNVQGYGHGVGLCQYGADGMGTAGYDYKAILKFYYHGVQITSLR